MVSSFVLLCVMVSQNVLEFERAPLSVVAEYMGDPLRFADAAAGEKTISGRYMIGHEESLMRAIQDLYPDLVVRKTDDGWVVYTR